MKFLVFFTSIFLLLSALTLVVTDCADAARMGGGRSFGSKPFMSTPAKPPAPSRSQVQSPASSTASRPGMGVMGGLFGGLLAGTLLGSLLSGNGFSGGGFMDIILLALLAFFAYKLFQRFRQKQTEEPAPAYGAYRRATSNQSGWDALTGATNYTASSANQTVDVPVGFDVDEFLRGAKTAYTRMQKSWDNRDLADIAQFATPAVMKVLNEQLANDPNPSKTELILINANLLGVENDGPNQRAQVYFDVLMRENPNQQTPESVREIWHFLREGDKGNWKLDGIQQVS